MNTTKSDKEKVLEKIRFLEARLVSLDFYLPETYQYLLAELDIQRCILAELEVEDAFTSIDQQADSSTDTAPGTPTR
jgi:hypothetical protein